MSHILAIAGLVLAGCSAAATPTAAPKAESKPPAAPAPTVATAPAAAPVAPTAAAAAPTAAAPTAAPKAAAPTAAAATAPPKPAAKAVVFDFNLASDSPLYTQAYVAMDQGFFEKEGVSPSEYTISRSSAATVQALAAGEGSAVLAPAAPDAFVAAIDKNAPVKVIAALSYLPPYSLMVQPSIQKLDDLKGKTCIQSSVTSGDAPLLKAIMATRGLQYPRDFNIVIGGDTSSRIAGMIAGAVDCALLAPPQSFQLMDQGKKEIAKIGDVIKDYHFIVLGINTTYAGKNRDVIVKALRAMIQGQQWASDPKNRESAAQSLITHKVVAPEYALRLIDTYYGPGTRVQVPDMKIELPSLNAVFEDMKGQGTLPKDLTMDWKKYVDPSFWEEATGKKFGS